MDWSFILKFTPMYIDAAILTLKLAFISIIFSIAIGLICSTIQYLNLPLLRRVIASYVQLSRNTPVLVYLFFLYFGLPKIGIMLSQELCAILGLSFLGGGYMSETFRSGFEAIAPIQTESGFCIGLNKWQVIRYIVLPQALQVSIPALCANIIFLIKETSVVSVVALPDLVYVAKDLIGLYYKTDESLLMLVIAYLLLLLPISIICTIIERRIRYARFGNQHTF